MKKLAAVLILAAAITMTGCQGSKQEEKPAASKTEEVNQASDELKEKLGDGYILPSEAVTKVLAKKWDVVGTESVYDLKEDGTGTLDGKALTFECGFDEDDNITMGIKMDGEEKEQLYAIEDDTTGYGLKLKSLDGGKDMELFQSDIERIDISVPAYHVPAWGNVLRATWERGWSFIKRAGTVILLATVILWFAQGFGFENGAFGMVEDQDNSVLAAIATKVAWIFAPLGFGNWKATVASVTGLIAKENVVGTLGVLYHFGGELSENGDEIWAAVAQDYTALSAYAFMIFNLLCAPCFAAMGAIKREMNNGKWTAFAIGYMCALAYCAALVVYQLGGLITGEVHFGLFTVVAVVVLAAFIYLMVRPNKYADNNEVKLDTSRI